MSFLDIPVPLFRPYALSRPVIKREGRLVRDTSMPERDWSKYEAPAYERAEFIRRYSGVKR
jgi:hypothetical protein